MARYLPAKQDYKGSSPLLRSILFVTMNWLTYLLLCADGTYYCGVTNDLKNRLSAHNSGKGAKYTAGRCPVSLVAYRDGLTRSQAAKLEWAVKKVSRERKLMILKNGDVG